MNIETKYFGTMSLSEDEVLKFPDGLFGFEEQREFVIIRFDNDSDSLLCLQSLKEPGLAFVLVNPFYILPDYAPKLTDLDLEAIGANPDLPLAFYAICVVRDNIADTSVNLRCPIAVNAENNMAKQFILEDSSYSFKHPLGGQAETKEE